MRLFAGIYLSRDMLEEVKRFIKLSDQIIGPARNGLKWTSPENLHFTLKFFGEVPVSRLNDLKSALSRAAGLNTNFPLQIGRAGCFPARGIPRIIWLGVTIGESGLVKMAGTVENACSGYGFPKEERPFSPHLTIARFKVSPPGFKFPEPDFQFTCSMIVDEFSLIESQLYRTGPIYRQVEKFRLNK